MEQQSVAKQEKSTSLSLEDFEPVNEYLLCRAVELPTHTSGGILLPDTAKDIWGGRGEIVLVSSDLNPTLNKFKPGQHIIYSRGIRVMDIWVEDEKMFLLHKREVGAIVKK